MFLMSFSGGFPLGGFFLLVVDSHERIHSFSFLSCLLLSALRTLCVYELLADQSTK